ncbi:MAG: replication-associated protein [Circoviridae sp.]|nr:MAG: replication-associated protein [Circoviridae sp.]
MSTQPTRELRLRGRNFLLTYPRCCAHPDYIIQKLQDHFAGECEYLCVCSESHQDGGEHRHVFLRLRERRDQVCRRPKEALEYVKKGDRWKEIGEAPFRTGMSRKEKNQLLLECDLEACLEDGVISLWQYSSIIKARNMYYIKKYGSEKREPPQVYWLYGPTGSGKTRYAVDHCGDKYWISHDEKWFDGYDGQENVILDDVRASSYKFNWLLRLLDRYPLQVPVKGGFVCWTPKFIYITAPEIPEKVFCNHETGEPWDRIDQLLRRITQIIEFPRQESHPTTPTENWEETEVPQRREDHSHIEWH